MVVPWAPQQSEYILVDSISSLSVAIFLGSLLIVVDHLLQPILIPGHKFYKFTNVSFVTLSISQ